MLQELPSLLQVPLWALLQVLLSELLQVLLLAALLVLPSAALLAFLLAARLVLPLAPELVPQQEFPALAEVLPVSQQPVPLPLLLRMLLLRFQTESALPSRPQRRYRLLPGQSD